MRERVTASSHFVCLSVCHFFILEKAPFSGLKLTSVHSRRRFKSFKCSTFLKIEAILEKKRVELRPYLRVGLQACRLLSFPANSKLVCY